MVTADGRFQPGQAEGAYTLVREHGVGEGQARVYGVRRWPAPAPITLELGCDWSLEHLGEMVKIEGGSLAFMTPQRLNRPCVSCSLYLFGHLFGCEFGQGRVIAHEQCALIGDLGRNESPG